MKKIIYTLLLLSVLLIFAGCPQGAKVEPKLTPQEHNDKFSDQTPLEVNITSLPEEDGCYVIDVKKYEGKVVNLKCDKNNKIKFANYPADTANKKYGYVCVEAEKTFTLDNTLTITDSTKQMAVFYIEKNIDITDLKKYSFVEDAFVVFYLFLK